MTLVAKRMVASFPRIVTAKDSPCITTLMPRVECVKHFIPNGRHQATTHRIENNEGNILHQDAKDFHFRDLILTRP